MAFDDDEKTQAPTPRRRQQMREAGQVAQSQDLNSAALWLGGLVVLVMTGGALLDFLAGLLAGCLSGQAWRGWLNADGAGVTELVSQQWNAVASGLARVLLPLLGLIVLVTVGINMLQTGFLFLPHRLAPDLSRVNPLAGMRRLFSSTAAMRLLFGVVKVGAIGSVAAASVYQHREALVSIGRLDMLGLALLAWEMCFWTCVKIGLALAVLAACDYVFQRFKHEREAWMTPQEVREELRELQGDAQLAARRRELQRTARVFRSGSVNPPGR